MSNIKAVDFAKTVEQQRQRLIQHIKDNNITVSDTASLPAVVGINNNINDPVTVSGFRVEYVDIDNTPLKTEYVEAGHASTPPATPSYDSTLLEFDHWAVSAGDDLNNITRDTFVLPYYRPKLDPNLNQRPTYLICHFATDLSPTLQIGNTHTNAYVLWGDGSTAEQITGSTISHTYAEEGWYTITIYGDNYTLGGNSNYGMFTTSSAAASLYAVYCGENLNSTTKKLPSNFANQSSNLHICIFDKDMTDISTTNGTTFRYCTALLNIVIPSGVTSIPAVFMPSAASKYVVLPNTITSLEDRCFGQNGYNTYIENIVLPDSITSITSSQGSIFYANPILKNINFPSRVTYVPSSFVMSCGKLWENKSVVIPSTLSFSTNSFSYTGAKEFILTNPNVAMNCTGNNLSSVILPSDYNADISIGSLGYVISEECVIQIANKLKDNTGEGSHTITLPTVKLFEYRYLLMLDANGDKVPAGTAGAVSLEQFIKNKNWTVTYSTY